MSGEAVESALSAERFGWPQSIGIAGFAKLNRIGELPSTLPGVAQG